MQGQTKQVGTARNVRHSTGMFAIRRLINKLLCGMLLEKNRESFA